MTQADIDKYYNYLVTRQSQLQLSLLAMPLEQRKTIGIQLFRELSTLNVVLHKFRVRYCIKVSY